jgi:putative peptidoglycan lipid II flippase
MFYNLAIIVAALVSRDVEALAIGVVVGAALHLAVQLPDLRMAGMAYRFVADWRDRAVREVGALMAPRIFGLAATQMNFYFIGIFFASTLSAGAISGLSFAWLIVMTPLGLIGMAISTAAFPTLAEQAATRDTALAPTLRGALRLIVFLSLPAGIALALLAKPVVVVLLQRGEFDAASTDVTANALLFYAPALAAHSGIEILSRGFYVQGDTRTPVAFAVVSMLVNLALAAALVGPMELEGVALALSVATVVECLLLLWRLTVGMPELLKAGLLVGLWRMAVATAVMGVVVAACYAGLTEGAALDANQGVDALAILAVCAAAGGLVYVGVTRMLGLEEPALLVRRVGGLMRRRADA